MITSLRKREGGEIRGNCGGDITTVMVKRNISIKLGDVFTAITRLSLFIEGTVVSLSQFPSTLK